MCRSCWEEAGSPTCSGFEVLEAAEFVTALYDKHPLGGAMHIATDDWNLDDDSLKWCEGRITNDAERGAHVALARLIEAERYSALALVAGFWVAH